MHHLCGLGIVGLTLISCSISTPPRATPHPPFVVSKREGLTPLLVFSHGHHTGLVLPRRAFQKELPEVTEQLTGDWLEFGWGDEGFYRSETMTFPLAFRALAYPTPGVMHVVTSEQALHFDYAYAPAKLFHLTDAQKQILVTRLAAQFARNGKGELKALGPGRYGTSQFYRARDSFFYPKTCNAWTASHLRAMGIKARAVTAPGLFRDLDKITAKKDTP